MKATTILATGSNKPARGRAQDGYTLLEISLALVVIAILVAASLPLTQGLVSEERLKHLGNEIADLAQTARRLAVKESRAYVIRVKSGQISLAPWQGSGREPLRPLRAVSVSNSIRVTTRTDGGKWAREQTWIFQAGGISTPIQIKLQEGNSWSEYTFNPLTAMAEQTGSNFE